MINPFWRKMRLSAFKISGDISKVKGFQMTNNIIMASWRNFTKKQYSFYFQRWLQFFRNGQVNPMCPTVVNVIDFLTDLF